MTLFGIAVGCIGLSVDDFSGLTPTEFHSIYEQWEKRNTSLMQEEWRRIRLMMWAALSPYSKKGLRPDDILQFDWEKLVEAVPAKIEKSTKKRFEYINNLWH